MKKKEYMIPQMEAVMLRASQTLLSGSVQDSGDNKTVTTSGNYNDGYDIE